MTRALGIDHGDARIGIAISDELGMLAHPMETIAVKDVEPIGRLAQIAAEKSIGTIIIGLTKKINGGANGLAHRRELLNKANGLLTMLGVGAQAVGL